MIPVPVPFSETPYIPEFKQLAAIVGKGKLRADLWDSWGLIIAKHSWKRVLRAANALEPDERCPSPTEAPPCQPGQIPWIRTINAKAAARNWPMVKGVDGPMTL